MTNINRGGEFRTSNLIVEFITFNFFFSKIEIGINVVSIKDSIIILYHLFRYKVIYVGERKIHLYCFVVFRE